MIIKIISQGIRRQLILVATVLSALSATPVMAADLSAALEQSQQELSELKHEALEQKQIRAREMEFHLDDTLVISQHEAYFESAAYQYESETETEEN